MRASADRPISPTERLWLASAVLAALLAALACQAGCAPVPAAETSTPATAGSAVDPAAGEAVRLEQAAVIRAMAAQYGVGVKVVWASCGEENSFYYASKNTIKLCTEMYAHPGAAVFFAAHEMGHAVTWALASTLDEHAADEVGALALISTGRVELLLEAAIYHVSDPQLGHVRGDPHPSNGYRAWELSCLADGSEDRPVLGECGELYRTKKLEWSMRLSDRQVEDEDPFGAIERLVRTVGAPPTT